MLNLFVASINISHLSNAGMVFGQRGGRARKHKYKFHFVPKLPSFCINQKCLMAVRSLHIL